MRIITNGCFDLFHKGHAFIIRRIIQWAGPNGEVLILVNSDESVAELKGTSRPIYNIDERIERIRLECESFICHTGSKVIYDVIKFRSEDELGSLINGFEPDMIVKGNDRSDVREIVGSINWPVCIIPRLKDGKGKDISTTKILGGKSE